MTNRKNLVAVGSEEGQPAETVEVAATEGDAATEEAPPFARIGLRLSLSGDTATVRDFLYAVETREPMLIVRRMDLSIGSGQGDETAENPTLAATFEIYGSAPAAILK